MNTASCNPRNGEFYSVTFYSFLHRWGITVPSIWARSYEEAQHRAERRYPYKYERIEVVRM